MSFASLTLHRGAVYVGRWARTARIASFDLDGSPLDAGFEFRDEEAGRSTASGIAIDDDRHVWIADRAAGRVRLFTLFGAEIGGLGVGREDVAPEAALDRAGEVRDPVDVAVEGDSDAVKIVVASGGDRRHALQVFGGSGALVESLRPLGDPRGRFRRIAGVGMRGRTIAVCETGAGRVQVFRDLDFHFAFELPTDGGGDSRTAGLDLVDGGGRPLVTLARFGREEGEVAAPCDLAVDLGQDDAHTRVFVADCDGDRVQVFTLGGRCYGGFPGLSGDLRLG